MKEVKISREPIELFKLLQIENLASSGGEAKNIIAEGLVLVNEIVETQKRKKLVSGDVITFKDDKFVVRLEATDTETQ